MNKNFEERCVDFDIFSRAEFNSKDIDPDYIVMKELSNLFNFNPYWYTFCYLNYYDIYSGLEILKYFPTPEDWNEQDFIKVNNQRKFVFCRERKGNSRKVEVQVRGFKEFLSFYNSDRFSLALLDPDLMRKEIMSIYNQGAMIAYKYIEVLQKSFGHKELAPPDCNMKNYASSISGTKGAFGVKYIYGVEYDYGKEFINVWESTARELAKAYDTDCGEIETCFCKYAKMCKGRYYVGYDIYEHFQLQEVIGEHEYKKIMTKHFDERYWKTPKIYKEHLPSYRDNGKIVWGEDFYGDKDPVDVFEIIKNNL